MLVVVKEAELLHQDQGNASSMRPEATEDALACATLHDDFGTTPVQGYELHNEKNSQKKKIPKVLSLKKKKKKKLYLNASLRQGNS